jgi:hypothetical protein
LIDDGAVVACNGVTECDQAINIATAIPIPMVPVEKKTLRITASLRVRLNAVMMDHSRFRTLASPSGNGVVQNSFVSWETWNVGAGFVTSWVMKQLHRFVRLLPPSSGSAPRKS